MNNSGDVLSDYGYSSGEDNMEVPESRIQVLGGLW